LCMQSWQIPFFIKNPFVKKSVASLQFHHRPKELIFSTGVSQRADKVPLNLQYLDMEIASFTDGKHALTEWPIYINTTGTYSQVPKSSILLYGFIVAIFTLRVKNRW
jgi:hypothetical protein